MVDLEEEFKELINNLHKEIRAKQVAGELTRDEADQLASMVDNRVSFPDTDDSWCASHGGWQASQECF